MFGSAHFQMQNLRTARLLFVLGVLMAAGLLIALPALMDVPSAGDVCNAGSLADTDRLTAEKKHAALFPLVGALLAGVSATVAIAGAAKRQPRASGRLWLLLGFFGLLGSATGVVVAFVTYAVIC